MAPWDGEDDNLFQDEEEDQEYNINTDSDFGKEFLVYMIDACSSMFMPLASEEDNCKNTYFSAVVKAVGQDMKNRIICRDADEVAICFFNTREKKNFQESNGVYVFQSSDIDRQDEPSQPTAQLIKDFDNIQDIFEKKIGSGPGFVPRSRENPLYNALWVAQGLLRKGSTRNSSKRILLFTNNDDPFGDADRAVKADLTRTSVQRAKDAQDLGISIELFPFNRPGEEFNVSIFYTDMLNLDGEEQAKFTSMAIERFEDIINQLRKRIYKKRMIKRLMLTISHGLNIAMKSYALLRLSTPGAYAWLDSSDNKLLKSETSFICADTGALLSDPVQRFQEYKGQKVIFTPHEMSEVKKVTNVQLQLMGFKPLECLKEYYNLRPATFLYPDEERVKGSNCAFIALHRSMLRLRMFALAFLGASASMRLVALIAQEEVSSDIGQVEPPGIYMIQLPYADDIRPIEKLQGVSEGSVLRATQEQIDKATAMMKKVELKDFSFESIQNPALQRHYAILQALALDEKELPTLEDTTMPDEKSMQKPAIAEAVKAFKDAVYGADHDLVEAELLVEKAKGSATAQKRKAAEDTARKDSEHYDWNELADSGKLKDLTVTELRTYLVTHKLQVTGKKEVLINRILTQMGK